MGNISRIRDLADKKGVQISFLSQAIGKSSGYLANVTSRDADVPVKYLPTLGTSVDYLLGKTDDPSAADSNTYIGKEYGTFQYDRFYALCKQQGKTQSHLYDLVGLPSKAGSNLRRTKNVKPEILEVWAKELHTTAAYLNGETDDSSPVTAPAAPEKKEKRPHGITPRERLGLSCYFVCACKNSSTACFNTAFGVVPASAHAVLNFSA